MFLSIDLTTKKKKKNIKIKKWINVYKIKKKKIIPTNIKWLKITRKIIDFYLPKNRLLNLYVIEITTRCRENSINK